MKQVFSVSGMRCSNCELLVTEALEELSGVSAVEASHSAGTVAVEFDEQKLPLERLKETIAQQGFTVQQ